MSATSLDAFTALQLADSRWARRTKDDPAPEQYLRHLLGALQPLLAPGDVPVDLDQATEAEQQRTQLEAAHTRLEVLEEQVDDLTEHLVALVTASIGRWNNDSDAASQVKAALDRIHQLITEPVVVRDPKLERELDAVRAERDTARGELRDLEGDLERLRGALEESAQATASAAAETVRASQAHDEVAGLLGQLVDAVNEEWHPDGDLSAQVDRAVHLVAAAADQLQERRDTGHHVCSWVRDERTGRVGKCVCGKALPKNLKAGLAGAVAKKGAA